MNANRSPIDINTKFQLISRNKTEITLPVLKRAFPCVERDGASGGKCEDTAGSCTVSRRCAFESVFLSAGA